MSPCSIASNSVWHSRRCSVSTRAHDEASAFSNARPSSRAATSTSNTVCALIMCTSRWIRCSSLSRKCAPAPLASITSRTMSRHCAHDVSDRETQRDVVDRRQVDLAARVRRHLARGACASWPRRSTHARVTLPRRSAPATSRLWRFVVPNSTRSTMRGSEQLHRATRAAERGNRRGQRQERPHRQAPQVSRVGGSAGAGGEQSTPDRNGTCTDRRRCRGCRSRSCRRRARCPSPRRRRPAPGTSAGRAPSSPDHAPESSTQSACTMPVPNCQWPVSS